jgi:hypothetical protein
MAAIFPTNNQMTAKMTSLVGMFIWKGHPLRVAFQQLVLPIDKGGINLISPGLKSKALFLSNLLKHSSDNPFISQFLTIHNPPYLHALPKIPYLKYAILELSYIPSIHLQQPMKSKLIYSFLLSHFSIATPRNLQKNWTLIWKNMSCKKLPSRAKALWYIIVNNKLPLKETLFNQQRISSPNCTECVNQIEDLEHRYVTCAYSKDLWALTQTYITNITGRPTLFDEIVRPELSNLTRLVKHTVMEIFAIFINFIENVQPINRDVTHLKMNLDNKIYF